MFKSKIAAFCNSYKKFVTRFYDGLPYSIKKWQSSNKFLNVCFCVEFESDLLVCRTAYISLRHDRHLIVLFLYVKLLIIKFKGNSEKTGISC